MNDSGYTIIQGLNWLTLIEFQPYIEDDDVQSLLQMNQKLTKANISRDWFDHESTSNKTKLLQLKQICYLYKAYFADEFTQKISVLNKKINEIKQKKSQREIKISGHPEKLQILKSFITKKKKQIQLIKIQKAEKLVGIVKSREKTEKKYSQRQTKNGYHHYKQEKMKRENQSDFFTPGNKPRKQLHKNESYSKSKHVIYNHVRVEMEQNKFKGKGRKQKQKEYGRQKDLDKFEKNLSKFRANEITYSGLTTPIKKNSFYRETQNIFKQKK